MLNTEHNEQHMQVRVLAENHHDSLAPAVQFAIKHRTIRTHVFLIA
jgi:hypothetical protein